MKETFKSPLNIAGIVKISIQQIVLTYMNNDFA